MQNKKELKKGKISSKIQEKQAPVPQRIKLAMPNSSKTLEFKVYKEDELGWPIESLLIKQSSQIRPKNGDLKRITLEQDYVSDKEVVNSAKQKLKREVKVAIEDHIGGSKQK